MAAPPPADPPSPVRQEFNEFLELLRMCGTSVSGVLTALGAAVPLTGFVWQTIAPPWPPGSPVIPTLASIFTIVILFLIFRTRQVDNARRWSVRLLIPSVFFGAAYLYLAANYIEEIEGRIHLTGWSLTPEAQKAVNDPKGPKNTTRELLDYFGHDSEDRIWQGRYFLRWALLILACFASAAFAGGISLLLVATIVSQRAAIAPPAPAAQNPAGP